MNRERKIWEDRNRWVRAVLSVLYKWFEYEPGKWVDTAMVREMAREKIAGVGKLKELTHEEQTVFDQVLFYLKSDGSIENVEEAKGYPGYEESSNWKQIRLIAKSVDKIAGQFKTSSDIPKLLKDIIPVELTTNEFIVAGQNIVPKISKANLAELHILADNFIEDKKLGRPQEDFRYITAVKMASRGPTKDDHTIRTRLRRVSLLLKKELSDKGYSSIDENSVIEFVKHQGFRFNPQNVYISYYPKD